MNEQSVWYFTAPWDPVLIRRGDALGFRAGADYFADLLAPGLSNSTTDARWISILSWCLKWSHRAWQNAGGSDLSRRDEQRARYAWLRPLELLWVARALESGQKTGQLRGRLSIERWRKAGRASSNFAMSPDQFRRYRQVGMYGAYRVVLRVPGLTTGDGWTPAETSLKLARLVNDRLPSRVRLNEEDFGNGTQWGYWSKEKQVEYWIRHGWAEWSQSSNRGLLPLPDEAIRKRLAEEEERSLLESALFGDGSVRRVTAEVLANAKCAKHVDLCDALSNSSTLAKRLVSVSLAPLPAFSSFADEAMHAMRVLWTEINHDGEKQAPTVEKLARSTELKVGLEQLRAAGNAWLSAPGRSAFPHEHIVTQLAEAMGKATTPSDQVRMLSAHHHEYGGGRRWFREESGKLVPLVANTGIAASDYRFRLRSLCLLAAQCGVARMDNALNAMAREPEDDEEKDYA
ncbi:hypothetical protein [Bradyrhizobium sp. USDA 3256]